MNILQLLICVVLLHAFDGHYSVYHSDAPISSHWAFDCLYAHLTEDEADTEVHTDTSYHLIPYCRRPMENEERHEQKTSTSTNNVYNRVAFDHLYKHGVTSEQLLSWSAPIDLVEQYAMKDIDRRQIFSNCSSPWFGSQCQYRFDNDSFLPFDEIVQLNFQTRSKIIRTLPDFVLPTCYPFLTSCSYRLSPACLDWREVCDGKFDCIDGEDEQYCQTLETNECPDDTYRCHYGGQCITLTFVRDKNNHIDCLDGTDETALFEEMRFYFGLHCYTTPTFRCEERTSRYEHSFQCSDGQYMPFHFIGNTYMSCANGRHMQAGFTEKPSFPYYLGSILEELSQSTLESSMDILKPILANTSMKYSLLSCPSSDKPCLAQWFFKVELIFAYSIFHFLYLPNRSFSDFHYSTQPDLICFDARICPGLVQYSIDIGLDNGPTCCRAKEISNRSMANGYDLPDALNELFLRCATTDKEQTCSHPSLFHCPQSSKCISKHRLVDGISDCYYHEDETTPTCQLEQSQRFSCSSEEEKCLSPIALYNGQNECQGKEDEMDEIERNIIKGYVPTGFLCDGQTHPLLKNSNETDESNCEYWPCNNPYTRCNSRETCPDSADELNCPRMEYNITEGQCTKTVSTKVFCSRLMRLMEEKFGVKIFSNQPQKNMTQCSMITTCFTAQDICQLDPSSVSMGGYCHLNPFGYCFVEHYYWTPLIKTNLCRFRPDKFNNEIETDSFFTSAQLGDFPSVSSQSTNFKTVDTTYIKPAIKSLENWFCNRGILVRHHGNETSKCLCPPSYFGDRCQWQNQRVSLTLQFIYRAEIYTFAIFQVVILLLDEHRKIHSYHEQLTFIPKYHCGTRFNIYLLYPDRPKDPSTNYSIHIDIFDKIHLTYVGSWHLSILFPFLPVNRIATQVFIPMTSTVSITSCPLNCGKHGRCVEYVNKKNAFFCRCQRGYSGLHCQSKHRCSCSSDSLCLSSSICVCPLNKFGAKCYLNRTSCSSQSTNPCQNNGLCLPVDDRMGLTKFLCLCREGFYGSNCEYHQNRIDIQFDHQKIDLMPFVFVHLITAFETDDHQQTTMLKKINIEQSLITIYAKYSFHIILIELIDQKFYLVVLREKFIESESIQTNVLATHQCLNVQQLINHTLRDYSYLRRVKFYPLLCEQNNALKCFYDERQMCFCDAHRFSNCLTFNSSFRSYNCHGDNPCLNDGLCLEDNPKCPTQSICICPQCYYGNRCQFSTRGFVLSLDYLLGYHIIPHRSIHQQSMIIKIGILITTVMFVFGMINGLFSIIIFRKRKLRSVGCGLYLYMASWNSVGLIIILMVKFWHLLFSQMSLITDRSYLRTNCLLVDLILKVLIAANDWLYAFVSIERVFTVIQGVNFNPSQSQRIAQRIIFAIYLFTSLTHLHDPLHRYLIDDIDIDQQRTWCIVQYSSLINKYNVSITLIHFLFPLLMNLLSTIAMIILIAYSRSTVQLRTVFHEHLREQFSQHKHRLIASCALLLLALPRLIISFISGCMKSPRNPTIFLVGYFISFLPSVSTFIVFVLPAKIYKEEFQTTVRQTIRRFRQT